MANIASPPKRNGNMRPELDKPVIFPTAMTMPPSAFTLGLRWLASSLSAARRRTLLVCMTCWVMLGNGCKTGMARIITATVLAPIPPARRQAITGLSGAGVLVLARTIATYSTATIPLQRVLSMMLAFVWSLCRRNDDSFPG